MLSAELANDYTADNDPSVFLLQPETCPLKASFAETVFYCGMSIWHSTKISQVGEPCACQLTFVNSVPIGKPSLHVFLEALNPCLCSSGYALECFDFSEPQTCQC
jgi:hypothetical protein